MKTVVLGLGISGKAVSEYLLLRGDEVIGVDRTFKQIEGISFRLESEPIHLENVDLVVKSPGISPQHPWVAAARATDLPIIGEIDLAFAELKKKNKTVYGITGSNGKTTTTLMAAHLLNTSGIKTLAVGNIGVPLITEINNDASVFVVELSSFQLEEIVENKILDGAVILNITPNHLDRHPSFEAYVQAKLRIALCLKENAPLYLSMQAAAVCKTFGIPYRIFDPLKEKVERFFSLRYREGRYRFFSHDLENVSAALALTSVSEEVLEKGVSTFVRPPHRLEWIRTINGVSFINDSKATSVDAVLKAVGAIEAPIILIAGGVDKGGAFRDWVPHFKGKVKAVLALGEASQRIEQELSPEVVVEIIPSLEEGIYRAAKMATLGGTVLLSPGCSSYDQFKDYQHRGDTFRQIVEEKL